MIGWLGGTGLVSLVIAPRELGIECPLKAKMLLLFGGMLLSIVSGLVGYAILNRMEERK